MLAEARPGLARPIFAVGFLAMLVAGGWNFYWFPPIQDGAYLIARYGRIETPWPAGVLPTTMLVSGLIILLHGVLFARAGTVPEDSGKAETAIEMGVFALLAILLMAALTLYLNVLISNGPGWWMLYALVPATLLIIAGCRLTRWRAVAIWLAFFSGAYALLVLASAGLFEMAVAQVY
jgi:hypothetical protein